MYRFSGLSGKITNKFLKMSNVAVPSRRKSKRYPLETLISMGYPKNRALKALTATGDNGVQLAADWLLAHVNDPHIDECPPRDYTLYAQPTGLLLARLNEFWQKTQQTCGWNGAHNFPPHITLVAFFKAPDELSRHIGNAVKQIPYIVAPAPPLPLRLEPYISTNFMGLFPDEAYNNFFKLLATNFIRQVSNLLQINLEDKIKSTHLTLAYHFEESAYEALKKLVLDLDLNVESSWEVRLYSTDPRYAKHKVYKVVQDYTPKENDELELVLGDLIYIEGKQFDNSPDGWVLGTSWLTGVSGRLLAANTARTADFDAWTLHEVVPLGNFGTKKMSSGAYPHEDAEKLGHEKSEEIYKEWGKYWTTVSNTGAEGIIHVTQGPSMDWQPVDDSGDGAVKAENKENRKKSDDGDRRWIFAMRHGERVDLTYGQWAKYCFNQSGEYVRKDLNMPLTLGKRVGGAESYARDTPLTRIGRLQAQLVGEGLRLAGVDVTHVYASAALRCVETAHHMLEGLKTNSSVKIKVEPGLFEYKHWHITGNGLAPFMTPQELHLAGYNVDLSYKPYVEVDIESTETVEECYERNKKVMHSALIDTEVEGGNVIFVGHAATLDMMVTALTRLRDGSDSGEYQISKNLLRVPYCALAAMRDRPLQLVPPPCPPSINSSSGRFDWKLLQNL